ncbi:MAG: class I SAM-dependent methyltransferase [Myxococcota bacterium]|nr:class I SAM-dependent methyltransferase [Myxococcota bacterium]
MLGDVLLLKPHQLAEISELTIRHYDENADSYWAGTCDHDVSQNIDALLRALGDGRHRILDFGCGPGRDLATFKKLGHRPVGLDGSVQFCRMARIHARCEVWHQDFLALDLPKAGFDGVYANASLFHIPSQVLPRALTALHHALRPGGVLFSSNPRGENIEGWRGLRYGAFYDLVQWSSFMNDAGFSEIEHYYRPAGQPRDQQPWLASTWQA